MAQSTLINLPFSEKLSQRIKDEKVNISYIKAALNDNEKIYIRSYSSNQNALENPVLLIGSDAPAIARILSVDSEGVIIDPLPYYKSFLMDLYTEDRLFASVGSLRDIDRDYELALIIVLCREINKNGDTMVI